MAIVQLSLLVILVTFQYLSTVAAGGLRVRVGGLFNKGNDEKTATVFQNIVRKYEHIEGHIISPSVNDSYSTALTVCDETSNGSVVAIIDARDTHGVCDTTCLLCNNLNITHLSLGWQPQDSLVDYPFTFSYHPPHETISKAYATLIKDLEWDRFSILYEDDEGLMRLQEIIHTWPDNQEPIIYKRLDPEGDNRELFKYILKMAHVNYHVLDCHVDRIDKYMKEVVDVDNYTQYQSFILTALDAYKVTFKDNPNLNANLSTLHLTTNDEIKWSDARMDGASIALETALAADAIHHLDKAIRHFEKEISGESIMQIPGRRGGRRYQIKEPPSLCFLENRDAYASAAWTSGHKLQESIKNTTYSGFTGNVEFDDEGKRINFMLHYSKMNNESYFVHTGTWDSKTDLLTKSNEVNVRSSTGSGTIKVVTRFGKPYYYIDESKGNNSYKGYAMDLIEAIFKKINENDKNINLKYEIYRVAGDKYGNPIAGTKKWDGLIGELLQHKADMAICDLTITSERNAVVEFSTPFMTLGISMLFKKPIPDKPDMYSFIKPLSIDVWLYLGTAYIIASYMMLISARMSQDDWVNPHPCNRNPESLQNIWNLYNCMWLTMGSIMTQGCDILPRAAGSRLVTGMWWFFALIITASYTANMSTFLSNSRRSSDITDVAALAKQSKVGYGAVYNASTYKFFKNSNESVYKKIWSVLESSRSAVHDNEEGRDMVRNGKGKYVFFMESTAIEYYTQRFSDLKMVGSELDSKEYGIAMPKNFAHKGKVDNVILTLQENGDLQKLKQKWWVIEDNNCSICKPESAEDDGNGPLQMENTSGIFLVLGLGGIIGLIVAVLNFLNHALRIAVNEEVSFKEALMSEWRSSLNPRVLHKPVAPPRGVSPSPEAPSPSRERSGSRAVSVLRAASSFINFDEIY